MKTRIKPGRPNHTTLVAYLALLLVIGSGAAYAAGHLGKNSVGAKQLKKNAVTTAKIKKEAVTAAKLKNGAVTAPKLGAGAVGTGALQDKAVTTAKIAENAVGGAQADESSFTGVIHGEGTQSRIGITVPANGFIEPPKVLADIPGFGQVRIFFCGEFADDDKVDIQVLSDENASDFVSVGSVHSANLPGGTGKAEFSDFSGGHLSGGGGEFLVGHPGGAEAVSLLGTANQFDWMLFRGEGPGAAVAHIAIDAFNSSSSLAHKGSCFVGAETIIQP